MKKYLFLVLIALLLVTQTGADKIYWDNGSEKSSTYLETQTAKELSNEQAASEGMQYLMGETEFGASPQSTYNYSQFLTNTSNQTPLEKIVNPFRWEPYLLASLVFLVLGMLYNRLFHWLGFFSAIIALTFYIIYVPTISGVIYNLIFVVILTLIISNGFLITHKPPNKR
jgi:hypothetical protein